jgi:hypothetical protein
MLTRSDLVLTPGEDAIRVPATRLVPRTLALDEAVVAIIHEWLAVRDKLPGDFVFCVLRGKTAGSRWSDADMRRTVRDHGETVLGKRLNVGALRITLTAELIVEQWPLPYIQTQLGLRTLSSFREIFPKLGITGAPPEEVAEIARARPVWRRTGAAA